MLARIRRSFFRESQTDFEQQNADQHTWHARDIEPIRAFGCRTSSSASAMSSIEKQPGRFARAATSRRSPAKITARIFVGPFGYRATAFPICCDPDLKPLNVTVRQCPPIIRDFTEASGTRPRTSRAE
jgi:hypothetical protein